MREQLRAAGAARARCGGGHARKQARARRQAGRRGPNQQRGGRAWAGPGLRPGAGRRAPLRPRRGREEEAGPARGHSGLREPAEGPRPGQCAGVRSAGPRQRPQGLRAPGGPPRAALPGTAAQESGRGRLCAHTGAEQPYLSPLPPKPLDLNSLHFTLFRDSDTCGKNVKCDMKCPANFIC